MLQTRCLPIIREVKSCGDKRVRLQRAHALKFTARAGLCGSKDGVHLEGNRARNCIAGVALCPHATQSGRSILEGAPLRHTRTSPRELHTPRVPLPQRTGLPRHLDEECTCTAKPVHVQAVRSGRMCIAKWNQRTAQLAAVTRGKDAYRIVGSGRPVCIPLVVCFQGGCC